MALTADWLPEAPQNAAMRCIGCTPLRLTDMLEVDSDNVIQGR